MTYIKGCLGGTVALFVATVLYTVVELLLLRRELARQVGPGFHGEISIDFRAVVTRDPVYWLIALTAFAAGFYWVVRRGQHARR